MQPREAVLAGPALSGQAALSPSFQVPAWSAALASCTGAEHVSWLHRLSRNTGPSVCFSRP